MDYACPVWRSAARSHIKKLQALQSKCLRIATNAPWYIGNEQIHDDLGVPYFSEHIRSLTTRFDSKLSDVGYPLVGQIGRYLPISLPVKCPRAPRIVSAGYSCQLALFRLPCFSSVVRQLPGNSLQDGARAALPPFRRHFILFYYAVNPSFTLV
jgi:hypothetical protein